ncbi:hypothetical protein BAZSYMB_SCAFFOLD00065_4 [Bathymodiolus azoricus thioautotrophic gill symbiont]|uniref:Uncharacterized protein n=1 Tax=Bathymodiolus azoricus thioautotrophic gill symbiont TaxID=235205 RepID=A0A1H6KP22_9GAMM|nr:hypothetical protein BAZSYMB_SCAFFOLD00065_4 [Bathymodiolus azoricus thioautotrophic gill symbiont]
MGPPAIAVWVKTMLNSEVRIRFVLKDDMGFILNFTFA